MHQIIRAIVYATDEETALDIAKEVFTHLVDDGVVDYFTTIDEEQIEGFPCCVEATSDEGKKLIAEGMQYTKEEFTENMQRIRKAMNEHTDEELFEDIMFRHGCFHIGQNRGSSVWIYDTHAQGITTEQDLKIAVEQYKEYYGVDNDEKVWVVPADVHL